MDTALSSVSTWTELTKKPGLKLRYKKGSSPVLYYNLVHMYSCDIEQRCNIGLSTGLPHFS